MRAPTPSAAAELVSNDTSHKHESLKGREQRLRNVMQIYLAQQKQHLSGLTQALNSHHPKHQLQRQSQLLDEFEFRLSSAIKQRLSQETLRLSNKQHRLMALSPSRQLDRQTNRLDQLQARLKQAMQKQLDSAKHQFAVTVGKLDTVSPLATLQRGYSITQDARGQVITNAQSVEVGSAITTKLDNGIIESQVTSIKDHS
ncbi:exodeoxyribonuclease VII large subunit [Vibrio variabilis]|uniref:Exodeoxyribonuclease VII large subunit n=1 Tax=Vibrio variabilis TaxID=990271 RepID=A0ABQ0J4V7_9VIBR|nr:exodeoxyribonuclease VII large subunit [Vibrio variabilis]